MKHLPRSWWFTYLALCNFITATRQVKRFLLSIEGTEIKVNNVPKKKKNHTCARVTFPIIEPADLT